MTMLHRVGLLGVLAAVGAISGCDLFPDWNNNPPPPPCGWGQDCPCEGCDYPDATVWYPPDADAHDGGSVPDASPDAPFVVISGTGGPCTTDQNCAAGDYCLSGTCTVSSFCNAYTPCDPGFYCDTSRSTCEPGSIGSCGGTVTCSTAQPTCPSGQVPTISSGCWTGNCEAIASCDVPPACSEINDQQDCLARSDCEATYTGLDCTTSNGSACVAGDSGCTCASFVFATCQSKN